MQQLLIDQLKIRLFDESFVRIKKCLALLNEEQIWHKPNEATVSVGNQVLHICGNLRQWLLTGLYDQKDERVRSSEFESKHISKAELIELMNHLESDIMKAIENHEIDLIPERKVQVFIESGVSIVAHAIEHCSYHTGQIALLTKIHQNADLGFYGDTNLEVD